MSSFTAERASGPAVGLTKKAVAGTAWSTLATVGKQVLTFASVATVARMLGPNAYGLMGMAGLIILFIGNFRDLGTGVAIIQRPTLTPTLLSSLFWVNLSVGFVFATIVWLGAPAAATFFHAGPLTAILRMLCLPLILASAGVVHSAILSRQMQYRALACIDFGAALVGYLTALGCALHGLGVWSLVWASITSAATTTICSIAVGAFWPKFVISVAELRSLLGFSGNLSAFGVVNFAYRNADNLIVGRILGSVPLGFYQMAYNLMLTPIQNISSVITQVLFPAFSRIQDEPERFREAYLRACSLIALVTFPVMAGLGVVADPLIHAVLGPKWIGTIRVFQILAPVGLVQSIQTTTGMIFQAKGRTDLMLRCGLLVLAVVVVAFTLGAQFGVTGVAASYAAAYLGLLAYPLFVIPFRLIKLPFRQFCRSLLPQLVFTVLMVLVAISYSGILAFFGVTEAWFRLLSTTIVGVLAYVSAILIVRPRVLTYAQDILAASEHPVGAVGLRFLETIPRRRPFRYGASKP